MLSRSRRTISALTRTKSWRMVVRWGVELTTLSVAITAWYRDPHGNAIPTVQAAAAALYVVPALLIFFFAQRYFIRSVVSSGVKGELRSGQE
jgi:ABC-type glycerol-3-phosphate transport system permease component